MTIEHEPETPPREVTIITSRDLMVPEPPSPAVWKSKQLRSYLHGIDGMLEDLDEAAEYLIAMKGRAVAASTAMFS